MYKNTVGRSCIGQLPGGQREVPQIPAGRYYSPGLLHDDPLMGRWSGDAGGFELGVVMVPSGAGLVASSPS
jgi:hypothetical protein